MAEPVPDLNHLRQWIGRSETGEDVIDAAHAAALAATFDRDWRPAPGEPLPTLWHWAFFRPVVPQSGIGHDGHPRLGGFMPPIPLPRRMWVGGRLTFHSPAQDRRKGGPQDDDHRSVRQVRAQRPTDLRLTAARDRFAGAASPSAKSRTWSIARRQAARRPPLPAPRRWRQPAHPGRLARPDGARPCSPVPLLGTDLQ